MLVELSTNLKFGACNFMSLDMGLTAGLTMKHMNTLREITTPPILLTRLGYAHSKELDLHSTFCALTSWHDSKLVTNLI
jgi:hypothetical protein